MTLTPDKDRLIFEAMTRLRRPAALQVGDLVVVAHASGVNEAHARAVVVEVYTLCRRPGWMLLFADGRCDGFSPDDCTLFGVERIGHVPALARYQFQSVTHLARDWREGHFAAAWHGEGDDTMEYRGFTLVQDRDGLWFAFAGGGLVRLGPFGTAQEAKWAVDAELDPS